jgi:hypothetical protein
LEDLADLLVSHPLNGQDQVWPNGHYLTELEIGRDSATALGILLAIC